MCLVVFAWRPEHRQPLLILANRDEVHARPSAALAQWADQPRIYAGRDLEAGGAWLGVAEQSRGALVSDYLASQLSPQAYLHKIAVSLKQYSGFNLLLGDLQSVWYISSTQPRPIRLSPGVYGLCNASLDTPWPKLVRARSAFAQHLDAPDHVLFELMHDELRADDDQLPDTGVGLPMERMLSSIFIRGQTYGTRAISLVRRFADGATTLTERSYTSHGRFLGQAQVELAAAAPTDPDVLAT